MQWEIIISGLVAVIANSLQDEIRFHWGRLFGHWFKPGTKLAQWFDPAISHTNKYFKSNVLTFIFSTVLVFLTDFWHFLKGIVINCVFSIILILLKSDYSFILSLLVLNLAWGVIFEGVNLIFKILSKKYKLS
jgi:hypothetical protein